MDTDVNTSQTLLRCATLDYFGILEIYIKIQQKYDRILE